MRQPGDFALQNRRHWWINSYGKDLAVALPIAGLEDAEYAISRRLKPRCVHLLEELMSETSLTLIVPTWIALIDKPGTSLVHSLTTMCGITIAFLRLSGYREMLVQDFVDIPNLQFTIQLLVCGTSAPCCPPSFDCSRKASFMGLSVNGRRVSFTENVFYEF